MDPDWPNPAALTDAQLKQTCRALGLPTRHQTRATLLERLRGHLEQSIITRRRERPGLVSAVQRIQRWWKTRRRRLPPTAFTNDSDFMTLEDITVCPFCLVEDTGHVYQFHPLHLARYFLQEGNFINPYTRKPLNLIELRRLDKMVKTYDPSFVSLCIEQKRITQQRAEEREHLRVCQLLHHECLQLIHRVIQFVQHPQIHQLDKMLFQVEHVMLPHFFDTFRQLFLLDHAFACESIGHILQSLQALWTNATVVHTREGCYLVESIIATMSQFVTSILPVLPAVLPELSRLQQARVR